MSVMSVVFLQLFKISLARACLFINLEVSDVDGFFREGRGFEKDKKFSLPTDITDGLVGRFQR